MICASSKAKSKESAMTVAPCAALLTQQRMNPKCSCTTACVQAVQTFSAISSTSQASPITRCSGEFRSSIIETECIHLHEIRRLLISSKVQGTDIDELPLHVTVGPICVEANLGYPESVIACMVTRVFFSVIWASEAERDEHTVQEPSSKHKILRQIRRRRVLKRNLPLKECLYEARRRRCITWSSAQVKAMTHVERNDGFAVRESVRRIIKDLRSIDTNRIIFLFQLRSQEGIGVKIFHLPWEERIICHHPDGVSINPWLALLKLQNYGLAVCICNGPMEAPFRLHVQIRNDDIRCMIITCIESFHHIGHVREAAQNPSSHSKRPYKRLIVL